MAFDVKYYIQAKNEIKKRKQANAVKREMRYSEIEQKFPEYAKLRAVMASTGAKIVRSIINGGNTDEALSKIQAENTEAAIKIKELLMKSKYPPDYLDNIYTCKTCKDTGVSGNLRCDCFNKLVRQFAAQSINSKSPLLLTSFDNFELERYPDEKIKGRNLTYRENMQTIYDECVKYAENFRLPNAGLLFIGRAGLGKTHLSLAIAGKIIESGFNVVYDSAPDLFEKIEREHFGDRHNNTMETLKNAELLILDDVSAEWEHSSFHVSSFYNLLNTRMSRGLPMIISTNLDMNGLAERYTERITSRLFTMNILRFFGSDMRYETHVESKKEEAEKQKRLEKLEELKQSRTQNN
jgi:DNA replication protein DnaC